MNLGFVMTLNPFFKFDGYWIASESAGRAEPSAAFATETAGLPGTGMSAGNQSSRKPYLLQIRPLEKYGLLAYSVVVNIFMGFYFCYAIPMFLYRFVRTFPDAVNELILYISNRMVPPFALLRNIGMQTDIPCS